MSIANKFLLVPGATRRLKIAIRYCALLFFSPDLNVQIHHLNPRPDRKIYNDHCHTCRKEITAENKKHIEEAEKEKVLPIINNCDFYGLIRREGKQPMFQTHLH
jgi:hypothetical protein